ncbi:MAG: mechanosensitive ion channel family protein [Candidatus Udaeobacter sp.]
MSVFDSTLWIRFRMDIQWFGRWEVPQPVRPVSAPASNPLLMAETTEELCKRPEIRRELERARGEPRPEKVETHGRDKFWFVIYVVVLIVCAAGYFLIGAKLIPLPDPGNSIAQRILRGVALITVVLAAARAISFYGIGRIEDVSTRFTLQRVQRLAVALAVAIIVVSIVFVNWYAAVAAFGVGSIIIGLAVQTPMKSFIAWIYILVRQPFRVGDRIKIADATGDVIDVSYLDTTLWEFGGQYLSSDHPSGRLIKFPNEKVLDELVYNYSWPLFPYIWNEIKFQIAYNADLEFIASTMQKITEEELGKEMLQRVQTFRELLARTPVDELDVHEHPRVIFRVSENTWLEAIVRYLVAPREAGRVKTRLIKKLLAALNAAPEKVMFPAGAAR